MDMFYLLSCKVIEEIYVYYFTEEILFNFQVIINNGCKQYRYLWYYLLTDL